MLKFSNYFKYRLPKEGNLYFVLNCKIMKKCFVTILLLYTTSIILYLCSCTISGSFAGLYSQYKVSYQNDSSLYKFLAPDMNIENFSYSHKVLVITDKNIINSLKEHKRLILYRWKPLCQSDFCYSLSLVYDVCKKNGVTFYPVSEYYDNNLMNVNLNANFPILVPNTSYYTTNLTSKYLHKFYFQLSIKEYTKGQFYYFKDGKIEKVFNKLDVINNLN